MIKDLKVKIAHFRSELFLARYQQALIEGQTLLNIMDMAIGFEIEQQSLKVIRTDITAQMQMTKKLLNLIDHHPCDEKLEQTSQKINSQKTSLKLIHKTDQKEKKQINSEENMESSNGINVGKWSKRKQTVNKNKTQQSQRKIQQFQIPKITKQYEQKQQQQMVGIKLETDQCQQLEKQIILPCKLPQFFKGKQKHKLIVCYFQKCSHLLNFLSTSLQVDFDYVQLDDLQNFSFILSANTSKMKIITAPFRKSLQKVIYKILCEENIYIILYSANNRKILTEKLSNLQKKQFQLIF